MIGVHPSGYYAWIKQPKSLRQKEDERLVGLIKQLWLESGCIYGYRKIHDDLMDLGETCGHNRVARLMKNNGLKAGRLQKARSQRLRQSCRAGREPP